MDFTHGTRDNRFYTEEEDEEEEERDEHNCAEGSDVISSSRAHPFLPISTPSAPSSSSSSALALNWVAASEPSASTPPTSTTAVLEKEHMFEKIVTPSDVGKLNRLVIPKQHAEKYFPLDASTHDRGLLLNFEDRNGKPWRFRYSYWNSSQSYVMTKGWSRFVKEKRLDAGDTVSFGRGTGETATHRLFIDWQRRPDPELNPPNSLLRINNIPRLPNYHHSTPSSPSFAHPHPYLSFARSPNAPWAAGRLFVPHAAPPPPSNYFYLRSTSALAAAQPNPAAPMVLDSIPVAHGKEPAEPRRRVRIFGVNLEQPIESADNTESTGLLGLQLRLGGNESASAAASSSSSSPKDRRQHSPPIYLDM